METSRLISRKVPRRACSWFYENKPNDIRATARYYANRGVRLWLLRIPGHTWPVTPEMNTARFYEIPSTTGSNRTVVKAFPTIRDCENEVKRILSRSSPSNRPE